MEPTDRLRRQQIIWRLLSRHGACSLDQIQDRCRKEGIKKIARTTILGDLNALAVIHDTEVVTDELGYTLPSRLKTLSKREKEALNSQEKLKIAAITAGLILGEEAAGEQLAPLISPTYSIDKTEASVEKSIRPISRGWIIKSLQSIKSANIKEKLQAFWSRPLRRIAIDSGTTTEMIAEHALSKLDLPREGILQRLTVATNSSGVVRLLTSPHVDSRNHVNTVLIGGEYHRPTEAFAGMLAEKALEAMNLRFGMAILGASTIDTSDYEAGADNDYDARLKEIFIERSHIRILVADSSKFNMLGGTSICYAKLIPSLIDIIVTDKIKKSARHRLEDHGIAVLTALSPDEELSYL